MAEFFAWWGFILLWIAKIVVGAAIALLAVGLGVVAPTTAALGANPCERLSAHWRVVAWVYLFLLVTALVAGFCNYSVGAMKQENAELSAKQTLANHLADALNENDRLRNELNELKAKTAKAEKGTE